MINKFLLYQAAKTPQGLFDSFLGGLYLIKGIPLFLQLAVLTLYPLSFCLVLICQQITLQKTKKQALMLSKSCSLLAFSLSTLLLFTPWDESFINLRHSLNLTQHNLFSFNVSAPSEGTVDFLVFYFLGLLGKLGLPLPELLLVQSWLGGILCVFAINSIAQKLEIPGAKNWTIFIGTLFPPLMLNSALGFATTLYAASILWALNFVFIKKDLLRGLFVLSLIPIVRWEGFWFVSLCFAFLIREIEIKKWKSKPFILMFFLTWLPSALIVFYRIRHFNSWIPVPVVYKSSLGNLFYSILGLRNLFLDAISTFSLAFLMIWFVAPLLDRTLKSKLKPIAAPLIITALSTLPYYISGGDWFPPSFARYFFPFALILVPFTWKLLSLLSDPYRNTFTIALSFNLFICAVAPTSSLIRLYELLFSHGSALLSLNLKKRTENPLYRPHYLSVLGNHFKNSTQAADTIGTSELATISYFADRDSVDFLGLTDANLARLPLRETPSFIRKNPKSAELPLLIFKRVAPERLHTEHPDYLYLFDFMIEILMDEKNTEGWTLKDFHKALNRWNSKFKGLVEPLYGGTEHLIQLGYTPIIVNYDNDFCALYFVHQKKLKEHQERLKSMGLMESEFQLNQN